MEKTVNEDPTRDVSTVGILVRDRVAWSILHAKTIINDDSRITWKSKMTHFQ